MMMDTVEAQVTSTMASPNARPMGIDMNSLRYIISSLTDIYADGVLACIREYSANARDSHETAGQTRPIEVTLPTAFNPNFKVKDWGTGMNYDELYKYCGHYGASTKREDNDTVGFFGLGFKSALTVVPQFSIVSIKDGIKHFATITRGSDTIGVLDVISSVPTDEPNGFEVTIPAGKPSEFAARADEFFMNWKPGTVLVNGSAPKSFNADNFEKVGELGYIGSRHNNSSGSGVTVVMGGIGYKLAMSWDLRRTLFGKNEPIFGYSQIFVNVPIGAVELVPNREALKLTDETKAAVKKHLDILFTEFKKQIASKVADAPTRMDALRAVDNFGYAFARTECKWKGESIPGSVKVTATQYMYNHGRRGKYPIGNPAIEITSLTRKNTTIFVETGSVGGDNSLALRHISSYAKAKDLTLAKVYMGTLGAEINPWVQEMINAELIHLVKVEDMVAAAKVYNKENRAARTPSGTPRETLTYPVGTATDQGTVVIDNYSAAEIDAFTGPVYYLHEQRYGHDARVYAFHSRTSNDTVKSILRVLGNNAKLVLVAANRKPSSLEARLKSVKISNAFPAMEKKLTKAMKREFSAADRLAHHLRTTGNGTLINAIRILANGGAADPVFGTLNNILSTDNELKNNTRDAKDLLGWNSDHISALFKKDTETSGAEIHKNLYSHFPLFRVFMLASPTAFSPEERVAFIEYFNSVFREKGAFKL